MIYYLSYIGIIIIILLIVIFMIIYTNIIINEYQDIDKINYINSNKKK